MEDVVVPLQTRSGNRSECNVHSADTLNHSEHRTAGLCFALQLNSEFEAVQKLICSKETRFNCTASIRRDEKPLLH